VTMHDDDRPPTCPGCSEPMEDDDLFCGACGTDLRSVRPERPPAAQPTATRAAGTQAADAGTTPDAGGSSGVAGDFDPRPPKPVSAPAGGNTVAAGAPAPAPAAAAVGEADPQPTRDDTPDVGSASDAAHGEGGHGEGEGRGSVCVACGTGPVGTDGHCGDCGHKQPVARDHWEREAEGVAAASDRGLRHRRNEDFFTVASATTPAGGPSQIAVVCDGVSSASRSDQASEAAAEAAGASMRESIPRGVHTQQAMHDALLAAAGAVDALATAEEREAQRNAPACTIVGAVAADGILTVGWVGDSRAYWVPDDRGKPPSRLTQDDSWAAQMVAAGLMSEAEAYADVRAHAITGWLGADAYELDPHTASFKPDRPGVVVVCSDGLWNYAETAAEMAAALPANAADRPLAAARHLVGFALDGGGHDNVTVALLPFAVPAETGASST
jgi:serine/threonine protein phosphatase PrpC